MSHHFNCKYSILFLTFFLQFCWLQCSNFRDFRVMKARNFSRFIARVACLAYNSSEKTLTQMQKARLRVFTHKKPILPHCGLYTSLSSSLFSIGEFPLFTIILSFESWIFRCFWRQFMLNINNSNCIKLLAVTKMIFLYHFLSLSPFHTIDDLSFNGKEWRVGAAKKVIFACITMCHIGKCLVIPQILWWNINFAILFNFTSWIRKLMKERERKRKSDDGISKIWLPSHSLL